MCDTQHTHSKALLFTPVVHCSYSFQSEETRVHIKGCVKVPYCVLSSRAIRFIKIQQYYDLFAFVFQWTPYKSALFFFWLLRFSKACTPGDNSVVTSQRSLIAPPGESPHLQPGSDSAPLRRPRFLPDMWTVQQNSSFVEVETDPFCNIIFLFFNNLIGEKKKNSYASTIYKKRHTGITRVESNKTWLSGVNMIQWRRDQDGSNPLWTSSQVNPVHFTVHSYWRFSTGQSLSKLLSISKVQLWGELKRKKL